MRLDCLDEQSALNTLTQNLELSSLPTHTQDIFPAAALSTTYLRRGWMSVTA